MSPLAVECAEAPTEGSFETTKASFETDVPGMILQTVLPTYKSPPGMTLLKQKRKVVGSEDNTDPFQEEAKVEDASMFAMAKKYWYVWLPLLLSNFLGSQMAPPEEGQPQAAAAVAGAGATAAGATATAGTRQRRGKRN